jgi:exopolysaccharide production protein ExoZ
MSVPAELNEARKSTRLESLDWLRGLMAIAVMIYHLSGTGDAATLIGKLGIYAVSIFFVLSGLSMALAYDRYIVNLRSAASFFVRRIFRIWPLLWLAVALVAIPAWLDGKPFSSRFIMLNLTTAFGFVAPSKYINQGAWSIGNEMVYYALTPLLIPAYRRARGLGDALTLSALTVFVLFAFRLISSDTSLAAQWAVYINPFNNLFFYSAGVALYYNFRDTIVPPRWRMPLLLSAIAAFLFYPATGDQISIASGFNRIALAVIVILIVFGFYKCAPSLPSAIGRRLKDLGAATYGVYLLHPLVTTWTRMLLDRLGIHTLFLLAGSVVVTTVMLALVLFRHFETPCIRLGKRLTDSWGRSS